MSIQSLLDAIQWNDATFDHPINSPSLSMPEFFWIKKQFKVIFSSLSFSISLLYSPHIGNNSENWGLRVFSSNYRANHCVFLSRSTYGGGKHKSFCVRWHSGASKFPWTCSSFLFDIRFINLLIKMKSNNEQILHIFPSSLKSMTLIMVMSVDRIPYPYIGNCGSPRRKNRNDRIVWTFFLSWREIK